MFERKKQGAIDVIEGREPLVEEHIDEISRLLHECLDDGQPMAVLDMGRTRLVDSAGLEMLMDVQENFEQRGGVLKLAAPNALCRDILSVSGVAGLFDVYDDVSAAVGSFLR